jgi:hypothetical protein
MYIKNGLGNAQPSIGSVAHYYKVFILSQRSLQEQHTE